ncbi:MAG: hypothetical protein WEA56_04575 [Balneolaceae bacterium]
MKKHNQFISFLFTLLIFMGMSVSILHTHGDRIDIGSQHLEIVQDHNFCAVCASLHKYTPATVISAEFFPYSEIHLFVLPEPFVNSPGKNLQNERAPPFIA